MHIQDLGWGLLRQFPPFRYFHNFSSSAKYMLAVEYHVHIWQVLPQLSCSDTCQIWMWCKEFNRYFDRIENFPYREINERSFSNPHPWPWSLLLTWESQTISSHSADCHVRHISFSLFSRFWIFFHWSDGIVQNGWPDLRRSHDTGTIKIKAWISNLIHYKVWDEITHPFPNFNGATIEVWEWMSNFIPHFIMGVITYPCWD